MDILDMIRSDKLLADKVYQICDIEILENTRPPMDLGGKITYSIRGLTFGSDPTGSEFIMLEDGSIGLYSSEGECGRIAENMNGLFVLLVNCPCFYDFLAEGLYEDKILLERYTAAMEQDYKTDFNESSEEYDWDTAKRDIGKALGVPLYENVSQQVMRPFYETATRHPRFLSIYTEDDGSQIQTDCLISRPLQAWMKQKAGM